jgi:uncharacterized SAM-binding protein YcdF (DUF218 family)
MLLPVCLAKKLLQPASRKTEEMNSTGFQQGKNLAQRVLRLLTILSSLALIGITLSLFALLSIGNYLVREDPLQKSSAIAVLTGSLPARALEAAELYRNGYAKEIWLTHPGDQEAALKEFGIHYPSEDEFNVQILRRQGVPARAIRILESPILNTADELTIIGTALRAKPQQSVIIVTNKSHTRRVHELWAKYHSADGKIIVHSVAGDDFDPSHWWKSTGSTMEVVHEVFGIANAWAGLPVQPAVQSHESLASNEQQNPPKLVRTSKSAD